MTGTTAAKSVNVNVTGANELRLVVTIGGDDFSGDHADWADARVTCSGDSTPPTVTSTTPVHQATGQTVTVNATATFSEAMNAATLTTTTVTLVPQGSSTPVAATVSYDATPQTVTLDPTASLSPSTRPTRRLSKEARAARRT